MIELLERIQLFHWKSKSNHFLKMNFKILFIVSVAIFGATLAHTRKHCPKRSTVRERKSTSSSVDDRLYADYLACLNACPKYFVAPEEVCAAVWEEKAKWYGFCEFDCFVNYYACIYGVYIQTYNVTCKSIFSDKTTA